MSGILSIIIFRSKVEIYKPVEQYKPDTGWRVLHYTEYRVAQYKPDTGWGVLHHTEYRVAQYKPNTGWMEGATKLLFLRKQTLIQFDRLQTVDSQN